ncbi:uncharacterized protein HMPREF1541_06350 [Cyphellophora europaea CBS 101466]|uniref:Uncharacterized protein n=1 Tax=Cyphellophora europaea (strain CBS 101466) TaxID=1220924 RepID=W2RP64_CYPE1|nr:uncharacterized protein HMPREF1541_06350 [Cyphellophora europaea CBS 101466]ETN38316.1 hypothetical protein HMPREF1541_06350 [Cyphellophora europaea CBS 101466]
MYIQLKEEAGRLVFKRSSSLEPRQSNGTDSDSGGGGSVNYVATIIVAVVVIFLLTLGTLFWTYLRRKRASGQVPKLLPGFMRKRWDAWKPRQKYASVGGGSRSSLNANTSYNGNETEERAATQAAAAGVDRHTSVRSVMTLPPYSQSAQDSEQVLGREGERAGMDTVVEFPETQDEEEARREEQMDSLYQIRLQRRREIAEREQRRTERREARERGDFARLEELRRESRARANNQSSSSLNGGLSVSAATMIAEHQSSSRERRVSSVAYADVGLARHDGTRIRANSTESERGGLLEHAAPMGDDNSSLHPSVSRPSHHRERSGSSALSISTNASDIEPTPPTTRAGSTTQPVQSDSTDSSSPTANRFTPDDSTEGEDIGESRIPQTASDPSSPQPPEYAPPEEWGEAPAYTERMASIRRAAAQRQDAAGVQRTGSQRAFDEMASLGRTPSGPPQVPQLQLPSISVEAATADNSPLSPREGDGQRRSASGSRSRRSRYDNEEFMS